MLLFITAPTAVFPQRFPISIHLMLLFIKKPTEEQIKNLQFQYISCYCLSKSRTGTTSVLWISIHLMLLFILHHRRTRHKDLHFNTSHVTVYPSFSSSVSSGSSYFNTSHVTVYHFFSTLSCASSSFQYISCYCLSILSISLHSVRLQFQHISCYCLSQNTASKLLAI